MVGKKVFIVPTYTDDSLYVKYSNKNQKQPVRMKLDVETGELSAYVLVGDPTTSQRALNRLDIEWPIPSLVQGSLNQLFNRVKYKCQEILDWSYIDETKNKALFGTEAADAIFDVEFIIAHTDFEDEDIYQVHHPIDIFNNMDEDEIIDSYGLRSKTDSSIKSLAEHLFEYAQIEVKFEDLYEFLLELKNG